jgi:hypothetical protein
MAMSNTAFSTPTTNIPSQPNIPDAIVIRFSSASDTDNLTIYGTVSAVANSELVAGSQSEVVTTSSFSALSQAIFGSNASGEITGLIPGTSATGDVRVDVNPTDGNTLTIGLTGNVIAYRFKNTLAAAYDVKIGATKEITSTNLNAAINASGTPGTEYYAGTLANVLVSSTVSVDVLTLTDAVPCLRQLAWLLTESASNFSKRTLIGGYDGATLFTIPAGGSRSAIALTFSTEDHTTATLPALMSAVSNSVATGGEKPMLRLWADQTIDYMIQSSTDLINWTDTIEGEVTLAASTLTSVDLAQRAEFIRFVVTSNANTTNTILDARVIY